MDFSQGILPVELVDLIWHHVHNLNIKTVHTELALVRPVYNNPTCVNLLQVHAINYNILRILSGMDSLTYSS